MKRLIFISILSVVFIQCNNDYAKTDFIGDWQFKDKSDELNYVTFSQDSIFTYNDESGSTRRFIFKLRNDSILMYININGFDRLADYGIVNSVSSEKIIIENNGFKAELERTKKSKINR